MPFKVMYFAAMHIGSMQIFVFYLFDIFSVFLPIKTAKAEEALKKKYI